MGWFLAGSIRRREGEAQEIVRRYRRNTPSSKYQANCRNRSVWLSITSGVESADPVQRDVAVVIVGRHDVGGAFLAD
jgi:hypothetical protein